MEQGEATLTYWVRMPPTGVITEGAPGLAFIWSGPPNGTKSRSVTLQFRLELHPDP